MEHAENYAQEEILADNNLPRLPLAGEMVGIGLFSYIISPSMVLEVRSIVGADFIEYLGGLRGAVVE